MAWISTGSPDGRRGGVGVDVVDLRRGDRRHRRARAAWSGRPPRRLPGESPCGTPRSSRRSRRPRRRSAPCAGGRGASVSRMSAPAPSPMTKPSRARSKGREARSGASLKDVDSARSDAKPAKARGVMLASVPTTMTASACPARSTPRRDADRVGARGARGRHRQVGALGAVGQGQQARGGIQGDGGNEVRVHAIGPLRLVELRQLALAHGSWRPCPLPPRRPRAPAARRRCEGRRRARPPRAATSANCAWRSRRSAAASRCSLGTKSRTRAATRRAVALDREPLDVGEAARRPSVRPGRPSRRRPPRCRSGRPHRGP